MAYNFFLTILVILLISGAGVGYILFYIPPQIWSMIVLLTLAFVFLGIFFSLVFYLLIRKQSFETSRQKYRRVLKRGAIVAGLIVVALILQRFFDIMP